MPDRYQVWVRGYGLVDSPKVFGAPGKTLDLRATVALTPALAAQYYPAAYWYSMLRIPEAAEFGKGIENVKTQAEWLNVVKTNGCVTSHQMSNAATRTLPPAYAHIKPSQEAWSRRILSGMRNGPTAASTIRAQAGKAKACGPPLPRAHRLTWKAGAVRVRKSSSFNFAPTRSRGEKRPGAAYVRNREAPLALRRPRAMNNRASFWRRPESNLNSSFKMGAGLRQHDESLDQDFLAAISVATGAPGPRRARAPSLH
ncbi:MAG: hypothetical protein ACXWUB_04860 [Burkholderiales bacterium]